MNDGESWAHGMQSVSLTLIFVNVIIHEDFWLPGWGGCLLSQSTVCGGLKRSVLIAVKFT